MRNSTTIFGLESAKVFLRNHPLLPRVGVEVTPTGDSVSIEVHAHAHDVDTLRAIHEGLGSPTWETTVGITDSATVDIDGVGVTLYFRTIVDSPEAQGPLREFGLARGLVAL